MVAADGARARRALLRFAYRWASEADAEPVPGHSTLVEFTLDREGDGTRLRVIESGFEELEGTDEQRRTAFDRNSVGAC